MRLFALLAAALALAVAGCGGSEADEPAAPVAVGTVETGASSTGESLPGWMDEYLAKPGPDIGVTFATSDYAPGENRIGFLVIRNDGQLVQAPTATVRVGSEADDSEVRTVTATLEPLGPHTHPEIADPHDHSDVTDLYVAHVDLPEAGRFWLVVEPEGAEIQAAGAVDVAEETVSVPVGAKAPASENPTLDDAPAEEITTARPPDTELLRHSIADSLEAGEPFVVVFATPKFCQTRTCGPTVEVVEEVRKEIPGVRYIHVEIYEDNDPQKGSNQWVEEWSLPTEPWTFLVDREGVVAAKFEGSVSVDELTAAVREHLL